MARRSRIATWVVVAALVALALHALTRPGVVQASSAGEAPPPRRWRAHRPRHTAPEVVGFLESGAGEMRPLIGWRSAHRRHRWHYATTDGAHHTPLRLPVSSETDRGRKCTAELGCLELMEGDGVQVPGEQQPLKVHLYE